MDGVRYFTCSASHGLMAPLSKVTLCSEQFYEDEDSGPYSTIFGYYQDEDLNKRRRTHTKPKNPDHEDVLSISETEIDIKRRKVGPLQIEKPSSLPQLNINQASSLPDLGRRLLTPQINNKPSDLDDAQAKKFQLSSLNFDEDSNKRDSLEFDESLGILTPEQMVCLVSEKELRIDELRDKSTLDSPQNDLPSPGNLTDFSLGIIDDQLLLNLTVKSDTTMNMELPLDSVDKSQLRRLEQTPSPEDLPLDPTPIVEIDPKTEPTKSKTCSFINSITSITSLDTGYQGDGEMSRPASRGADNSPLTRRPLPRPQTRRPDPMTDSDFYTESDADNHEENALRGDRRAQVIDGTLYGVDPQAAADIYVNNRENMDSSGIFTDIESNQRNEETIPDISPSDTSSKTISGNSQNNLHKDEYNEVNKEENNKENTKKRNAPASPVSGSSSIRSTRLKEENTVKKYKMPKREVASKVKTMLETTSSGDKKTVKKPAGRWDAVMNKISKNEQNKTNLKEVKSKVFNSLNVNIGRAGNNPKTPNTKL